MKTKPAKVELIVHGGGYIWNLPPHATGSGTTQAIAAKSFKRFCDSIDARGPFEIVGDDATGFLTKLKQAK